MGVTPIYAFPFPALSDPPNGASQIQSLATAVENKIALVDATDATQSTNITNLQNVDPIILAWGRRTTPSSTTTTTVGVLRLDGIPVISGRAYNIMGTGICLDSTVTSDALQVDIRFTTNGTNATTASPILTGSVVFGRIVVLNSGESKCISCQYEPAGNQTLSLLLCVSRIAGSGNSRIFGSADAAIEMKIFRSGNAVGDTGVDI